MWEISSHTINNQRNAKILNQSNISDNDEINAEKTLYKTVTDYILLDDLLQSNLSFK